MYTNGSKGLLIAPESTNHSFIHSFTRMSPHSMHWNKMWTVGNDYANKWDIAHSFEMATSTAYIRSYSCPLMASHTFSLTLIHFTFFPLCFQCKMNWIELTLISCHGKRYSIANSFIFQTRFVRTPNIEFESNLISLFFSSFVQEFSHLHRTIGITNAAIIVSCLQPGDFRSWTTVIPIDFFSRTDLSCEFNGIRWMLRYSMTQSSPAQFFFHFFRFRSIYYAWHDMTWWRGHAHTHTHIHGTISH